MTFTQPKGKTAEGTYELSVDNKTLIGTEDGIKGRFTRDWRGYIETINDEPEPKRATSNPTATPVAPGPGGVSPAASDQALDYFAWGKEVCSLGRSFFYQVNASEKEASLSRQRALIEKLQPGREIFANFEALATLARDETVPPGNYSAWTKLDQRRWDNKFLPAAAALETASNRFAARTPEKEYFYLLGFETYALSVALPENVRNRGLRDNVTRSELQKGLGAFVWLRDNMPANRLSPEVVASVNGLANYKAGVRESPPQAEMEKIIALAAAISDADKVGKLLR